jgi:uncharacterized protein (DUF2236 family)
VPSTPAEGLFGPDSMVWRVDRELAVLVGSGSRALLMQIAHPKVAAAVAKHSRFQTDPLGRLFGTLSAIYTFAFADASRATRTVESINHLHSHVNGTTSRGEPYAALDPHLLLWVYATLIDSSLLAYDTFVGLLAAEERERYYAELRTYGSLWGIPVPELPTSLVDLRLWMNEAIESGEVHVTSEARELAKYIVRPHVAWLPGIVWLPFEPITAWLLPPVLRDGFGFIWGPRREHLMQRIAAASRRVVPHLPSIFRELPQARSARRRVALARASGLP